MSSVVFYVARFPHSEEKTPSGIVYLVRNLNIFTLDHQ